MGGKGKQIVQDAKDAANIQMKDFTAQQRTAKAAVEEQKAAYKKPDAIDMLFFSII